MNPYILKAEAKADFLTARLLLKDHMHVKIKRIKFGAEGGENVIILTYVNHKQKYYERRIAWDRKIPDANRMKYREIFYLLKQSREEFLQAKEIFDSQGQVDEIAEIDRQMTYRKHSGEE